MPWDMVQDSVAYEALTDGEKLDRIITALRAHGHETTVGIERIEYKDPKDVLSSPVAGTVFQWVEDALREQGVQVKQATVGGVMSAMGANRNLFGPNRFKSDEDAQIRMAHIIGCHCHSAAADISGYDAAARLSIKRETVRT